MLERLLQAAIITFLLNLIAVLNPNYTAQTKAASTGEQAPTPAISWLQRN